MADLDVVLLAAGNASRFGSAKQRAVVAGVSMVRRAAHAAIATGAAVSVITGAYADEIAQELAGLPLTLLHNVAWQQGMGSSIACGFKHLIDVPASAAAIVSLVDQPLVGVAELQRLISAHHTAPERIIAADHGTTLGAPCLFPRRYYAELAGLAGTQGARRLLDIHAQHVTVVTMPEASVDIDTPFDYERLIHAGS